MVKIYDADQVTLSTFGFLVDSGFADGEFISIEHLQPRRTSKQGTDGEIVTSKTTGSGKPKHGKMTVKLMQTSDGNSKYAAVAEIDDRSPNGAGVGPFLVRDRSGTMLMAGNCWIEEVPDPTFDREATPREWVLGLEIEFEFQGGS